MKKVAGDSKWIRVDMWLSTVGASSHKKHRAEETSHSKLEEKGQELQCMTNSYQTLFRQILTHDEKLFQIPATSMESW